MQAINSTSLHALLQPLVASSMDQEVSTVWLWIRVIAFLGLMGASAYFLTNYTRKRRVRSSLSGEGKIVVADTCSLGNRQFLVVAQYGAEKYLIGVSPSSISYLSRLSSGASDFQHELDQVESKSEDDQVV
jgi:flagellar biogenesis protein FliO